MTKPAPTHTHAIAAANTSVLTAILTPILEGRDNVVVAAGMSAAVGLGLGPAASVVEFAGTVGGIDADAVEEGVRCDD